MAWTFKGYCVFNSLGFSFIGVLSSKGFFWKHCRKRLTKSMIFYRLYFVKNKNEGGSAMSLPDFKPQMGLFGVYGALGLKLDSEDRYRLFAEKIYPLVV